MLKCAILQKGTTGKYSYWFEKRFTDDVKIDDIVVVSTTFGLDLAVVIDIVENSNNKAKGVALCVVPQEKNTIY